MINIGERLFNDGLCNSFVHLDEKSDLIFIYAVNHGMFNHVFDNDSYNENRTFKGNAYYSIIIKCNKTYIEDALLNSWFVYKNMPSYKVGMPQRLLKKDKVLCSKVFYKDFITIMGAETDNARRWSKTWRYSATDNYNNVELDDTNMVTIDYIKENLKLTDSIALCADKLCKSIGILGNKIENGFNALSEAMNNHTTTLKDLLETTNEELSNLNEKGSEYNPLFVTSR